MLGWADGEAGAELSEVFEVINEETPDQEPARSSNAGRRKDQRILEECIDRREVGAPVSIDHSAAPMKDSQGNVTGLVLVFRDVSQQKLLEGV
jgi:PAS domain-containing protein